jgi:hypothetical protein
MSNGIYQDRYYFDNPTDSRARGPSLTLRLRTRWERDRLDERIARGADPGASPELELRAQQLCTDHERNRLARALEDALEAARTPARPLTVSVPLRRAAVRESAQDIEALIRRLRDDQPVDPQGAALTRRLVSDGASPLYYEGGQPLRYAVRFTRLALDVLGQDTGRVSTAA